MLNTRFTPRWWTAATLGVALMLGAAPTYAQDELAGAAAERERLYNQRLEEIRSDPNLTTQERIQQLRQLEDSYASDQQARQGGMAGRMNDVADQTANGGSDTPGFWDKAGDKMIDILGELLSQAIQNWLNNPTEENLARINDLEAERDRLMNERDNPAPGTPDNGFGRPVYDDNGNIIGWDRDGDGQPDFTDTNGDGTPDDFNGGTYDDGYADPYDYLDVPGDGNGTPVYDSNGNLVGFDTNGDGVADTSGNFTDSGSSPIYDDAGNLIGLDTNGDGVVDTPIDSDSDDDSNDLPGFAGGGGGGFNGGNGNFGNGFGGPNGAGTGLPGEGEDGEGEDGLGALSSADGEDGFPTGGSNGLGEDGAGGLSSKYADADLQEIKGRIIVLPKPDEAQYAGNQESGSGQWEDEWDDQADNGDWDSDWNDDSWGSGSGSGSDDGWGSGTDDGWGSGSGSDDGWGSGSGSDDGWGSGDAGSGDGWGSGADSATPRRNDGSVEGSREDRELVEQLIRVETVIAEWRRDAKEAEESENDPYGYQESQGYHGGSGGDDDPLADVRDEFGALDLTKVDLWVISDDSWEEGEEPVRYKLEIGEGVENFEPIPGGYVVLRGVEAELEVKGRVLDQIRGEVMQIEVAQVVASTEEEPVDEAPELGATEGSSDDDWSSDW